MIEPEPNSATTGAPPAREVFAAETIWPGWDHEGGCLPQHRAAPTRRVSYVELALTQRRGRPLLATAARSQPRRHNVYAEVSPGGGRASGSGLGLVRGLCACASSCLFYTQGSAGPGLGFLILDGGPPRFIQGRVLRLWAATGAQNHEFGPLEPTRSLDRCGPPGIL